MLSQLKLLQNLKESIIIGVDEAGRGCLAGPVFAGAVILQSENQLEKIRDSKTLSENQREEIFAHIVASHRVGIGFATVGEITQFNILNAALMAMKRAVENLNLSAEELLDCHVLVDGNQKIRNFSLPQTPIIKGDQKVKAISAASIVAKVMRDRVLRELDKEYPKYGYAEHKGYATELHRGAIKKYGPTEHHRPTFAGVKEFLKSSIQ